MARGFKKTRKGIVGRFETSEARLLQRLFADVAQTLEPGSRAADDPLEAMVGIESHVAEPTDPAVRRLLPAASTDPARAEEFRRLTDRTLRESKMAALRASSMALESAPVVLSLEQAQDFARSLNDVRLVLASRLNLDTAQDAERIGSMVDFGDVENTGDYMAVVYNFISWSQESLMDALLRSLDD